jgi:hypothetical protein
MPDESQDNLQDDAPSSAPKRRRFRRVVLLSLFVVIAYGLVAYLVLPAFWTHYEHQQGLATLPMVTRTAQGSVDSASGRGVPEANGPRRRHSQSARHRDQGSNLAGDRRCLAQIGLPQAGFNLLS